MRLLIELEAERDTEYVSRYHHKLRGRLWRTLDGTPFEELHGVSETPTFVYSNPFPPKDYQEGDKATVLVSSIHDKLIHAFDKEINPSDEFNVGEMPFTVSEKYPIYVDVGHRGESGTLRCSTGIHLSVYEKHRDEYDISGFEETNEISWTPNMPLELFFERLLDNANWKLNTVLPDYIETPDKFDEIFESVDFGETYPVKVPITSDGFKKMFIVTQADFNYTVRDSEHRRILNTLLDSGVGWRNSLGFGFLNKRKN